MRTALQRLPAGINRCRSGSRVLNGHIRTVDAEREVRRSMPGAWMKRQGQELLLTPLLLMLLLLVTLLLPTL